MSLFAFALGIASFAMTWDLLYGKPWAWTAAVIITVISLVIHAASFNIIGIIISKCLRAVLPVQAACQGLFRQGRAGAAVSHAPGGGSTRFDLLW